MPPLKWKPIAIPPFSKLTGLRWVGDETRACCLHPLFFPATKLLVPVSGSAWLYDTGARLGVLACRLQQRGLASQLRPPSHNLACFSLPSPLVITRPMLRPFSFPPYFGASCSPVNTGVLTSIQQGISMSKATQALKATSNYSTS